jgi:hypothetical protein
LRERYNKLSKRLDTPVVFAEKVASGSVNFTKVFETLVSISVLSSASGGDREVYKMLWFRGDGGYRATHRKSEVLD